MKYSYQKSDHNILVEIKDDLLGNDKGQKTDYISPGKGFGLKGNNSLPTVGTIEFMSIFNF